MLTNLKTKNFILLLLYLAFAIPLSATSITWTGAAGDNDWTTAGNWDGGVAPTGTDEFAVFPINATVTMPVAGVTLGGIILTNSSSVELSAGGAATVTIGAGEAGLPKGVSYNLSGGQLVFGNNVTFTCDGNSSLRFLGQDGNKMFLGPASSQGADVPLDFRYQKVNPRTNLTTFQFEDSVSDLVGPMTVRPNVQIVYTGTCGPHNDITLQKNSIMLVPAGGNVGHDGEIIVSKRAQIIANGTFGISALEGPASLTNNGTINLITGDTDAANIIEDFNNRSVLNIGTFGNATTEFTTVNADEILNSGTINSYGTSSGANTFTDAFSNSGTFNAYGGSVNTFGAAVTNSRTMNFYGDYGLGTTNEFQDAVTNSRTMNFYGVADTNGAGTSTNTITPAGSVTNSGKKARLNFYNNAVTTFAGNLTNEARGIVSFLENTTNTFDATSTITNSSTINFYGNSDNTLNGTESIVNSGTINFYGQSTTACAHILDGAGTINVFENAELTVTGAANTATGQIRVYNDGVLTLGAAATFTGDGHTINVGGVGKKKTRRRTAGGTVANVSGTTTSVQNLSVAQGGTVSIATNSTLNVAGNYSQTSGTFTSVLGSADTGTQVGLLAVAGDITLGGACALTTGATVTPGDFVIMTYAGELTGEFSSVTVDVGNVTNTTYDGGNVTVTYAAALAALNMPAPVNDLNRNDRSFARFLFRSAPKLENHRDAKQAVNQLARQTPKQFRQNIKRLKPVIGAVSLKRGFEYKNQFRGFVNSQFLAQKSQYQSAIKDRKVQQNQGFSLNDLIAFQRPQSFFFTNSTQEKDVVKGFQGQYESRVDGADLGHQKVYRDQLILENVLSCSKHELISKNKMGDTSWTSVSYAPSVGILTENAYAKVMVLGGASFYDQIREVSFAEIHRKATSDYHSLDALVQLSSGYQHEVGGVLFEGDANAAVQNVYTSGYSERGAQGLNLVVANHNSLELISDLTLRASKRFEVGYTAMTPQVYLGYSAQQKVGDQAVKARFAFTDQSDFFETSKAEQLNQKVTLGSKFSIQRSKHFEVTANVELNMLKPVEDVSAKAQMNWIF